MYILNPIFHQAIWGGNRLSAIYKDSGNKLAHLYSVLGKQDTSNIILNGPHQGRPFGEVFNEIKFKFGMAQYNEFPLTIALVDAADNLSIQVHPDDINAKRLENGKRGKRESWFFIRPPDDGYIYNGCLCDSLEELKTKISNNEIMSYIGKTKIKRDDYIFIEPGTVHALTTGCFVYEIEEGDDLTYRVYDYERIDGNGKKRELHTEKAMSVIDIQKKGKESKYIDGKEMIETTYTTRKLQNIMEYHNTSRTIVVLTVIKGDTIIKNINLKIGMSVLLEPREKVPLRKDSQYIIARLLLNGDE